MKGPLPVWYVEHRHNTIAAAALAVFLYNPFIHYVYVCM